MFYLQKAFFSEDAFRQHVKERKHVNGASFYQYKCGECKKLIPVGSLTAHLQEAHKTKVPGYSIVCKICKDTLKESEWGGHLSKKHKKDRGAGWCQRCHKKVKEGYEKYILQHPGQCLFCDTKVSEDSRAIHVEQEHKIACHFCGEEISIVRIFVHFLEKHPVYKGSCNVVENSQAEGKDSNASVREICKHLTECSVSSYLCHLYMNHGNIYDYCTICQLPVPRAMVLVHVRDFHRGWFIDCDECKALRAGGDDYDDKNGFWRLAEGHREAFHEGKGFFCNRCVKNIFYEEENHDNRKAPVFRAQERHLLLKHKECFEICSICKQQVRKDDIELHRLKEHSDRFGECNLCGVYERSQKMFPSALAEKEFHAKKMHCVYSVCKKCGLLVLASDMDYHKEHIHPESKIQCYHGSIFDFDKEGEKYLKKHRVKCWMCCGKAGKKSKRGFKIGHMSHDHKCGQNCRPIVTTEAV